MPGDLAARADRMARGLRMYRDHRLVRERPNHPAFAAAFPTLIRTRPGSNAAAICAGQARWHIFLIGTSLAACLESDLGYYCPIPPLLGSPKLIDRSREALRARHYSRRTEQTYCHWVKRYIYYHHVRHPAEVGEPEINAFLTHPAVKEKVSASPQNQALCALLFLYRHVLDRPVGDLGEVIRARKPKRLPVVMTRDEVKAVPADLSGDKALMAALMYGAGLRLMECLRLRVQDIDFARREIMVRDGKGAKDCITMLPDSLKMPLQEHLRKVQAIHEKDVADGWGRVQPPMALGRKYPNAPMDWRWQWVFPQEHRWKNAATGEEDRRHVDESILQKAFKQAVDKAGFTKRATCHTLRHAFATHLLEDGYDIRTAQELLGHTDVRTTMIYTRVLNRGPRGVKSPVDML